MIYGGGADVIKGKRKEGRPELVPGEDESPAPGTVKIRGKGEKN